MYPVALNAGTFDLEKTCGRYRSAVFALACVFAVVIAYVGRTGMASMPLGVALVFAVVGAAGLFQVAAIVAWMPISIRLSREEMLAINERLPFASGLVPTAYCSLVTCLATIIFRSSAVPA